MKDLVFVGSSLEDLCELPEDVKDDIGYALHIVQSGETPNNAKMLKGFGSGVWEIRDDYKTDTYRAVYVTKVQDTVYVLHCFQKKSKSGIGIPKNDKLIIESRLKSLPAK